MCVCITSHVIDITLKVVLSIAIHTVAVNRKETLISPVLQDSEFGGFTGAVITY